MVDKVVSRRKFLDELFVEAGQTSSRMGRDAVCFLGAAFGVAETPLRLFGAGFSLKRPLTKFFSLQADRGKFLLRLFQDQSGDGFDSF